jgi:8-amino-7-oxononanoate synthase
MTPPDDAHGRAEHVPADHGTPLPRTAPIATAEAPLAWLGAALAELDEQCLRRRLATRSGPSTPGRICLDGVPLVNFSANDYLGLAADERLVDAVVRAAHQSGWGSGASPVVSGRGAWQAELERALAEFEGTAAALLFPSGYAANVGAISALAGKQDIIFSDAWNHASIIDGCRLSGAQIEIYPHRDSAALRQALARFRGFRRRLIVTDALFSMDGDLASLPELVELAEHAGAMLLVDEAHGTGVFGAHGRGVCEHWGVEGRVPVRVGTLSKALGSSGGFVAGPQSLIDWLSNRARPYVFSTAPPEALAAAALAALRVIREEPQRRERLLACAEHLRRRLRQQGWDTGESVSQIVPVIIGDPERTMQLASRLRERGLLVPGIRPPSVPDGESRLRISLSAAHTDEMIGQLEGALHELSAIAAARPHSAPGRQ